MHPRKIRELTEGQRSVCEGHTSDCLCSACDKVRSLILAIFKGGRDEGPEADDNK